MLSQKNAAKVLAARERKYRRRDAAIQQAYERNAFESPGHDVLTGRGNGVHHSSGNILFRKLLEQQYELYNSAAKKVKLEIRESIYNDITVTRGMRFLLHVELKNGEMQWIRQPKEDAMEKIRQGLCDVNLRKKKKRSANSSPEEDLVESVHKDDEGDATSRTLAPRPSLVSLLTPSSGAHALLIGQDSLPLAQTAQSRKKVFPCLQRQSGEVDTPRTVQLSSLISSLSDDAAATSDNRLLNNFTSSVLTHILEGFGQQ